MKIVTLFKTYALLLLLIVGYGEAAFAQNAPDLPSIFERLTAVENVKMTLETDLTSLIEQKKSELYFPGTLTTEDGKTYKVEIKVRGKYRRKAAEIPPLKLKFGKKSLKAEGLDTLNEIKLVLPVFDNAEGDELLLREYVAYRMYEYLTPASVRARLIRLTIRDTHVEKSKRTVYAILMEHEEETAVRLKGTEVEAYGLPLDSMITNQVALVSMFQYMIGNTDWDIPMQRNVRLIRSNETGKILVVPYDFDFSGFVAAPYASPSTESGLRTVLDRYLMSNGVKPEALRRATQSLKQSRKGLEALCKGKLISKNSSMHMLNYLDSFFDQIDEKDLVPQTMRVSLMD
ncbi:MAG: hypothetical protein IT270_13230 [Saprospiraceae bacterium]|nr:hypothetical protein [Saprospiraceae bacterium]